jgi:hypothetical protein
METALQELISKLTDIKNDLVINYENAKKEQERTEISIEIVATLSAISEAKKLLPKEQEAIEQAYDTGAIEMYDIDATARNYFNQTYKEHGK